MRCVVHVCVYVILLLLLALGLQTTCNFPAISATFRYDDVCSSSVILLVMGLSLGSDRSVLFSAVIFKDVCGGLFLLLRIWKVSIFYGCPLLCHSLFLYSCYYVFFLAVERAVF